MSEQHRNGVAAVLRQLADRVETDGLVGYRYESRNLGYHVPGPSMPGTNGQPCTHVTISVVVPDKS